MSKKIFIEWKKKRAEYNRTQNLLWKTKLGSDLFYARQDKLEEIAQWLHENKVHACRYMADLLRVPNKSSEGDVS